MDDTSINNLPPGPYEGEQLYFGRYGRAGLWYIKDRRGRKIGILWGKPAEKDALTELMIKASDPSYRRDEDTLKGLPPSPFQYAEVESGKGKQLFLQDANGRNIASFWGNMEERKALITLAIEAREKISVP